MKIALYINLAVLILAPEFAFAQDATPKYDVAINLNEQATASQLQTDQYQHTVQRVSTDNSLIELNAFYARSKFTADPDLYSEIKQPIPPEPGVISGWRERIFNSLKTNFGPVRQDQAYNSAPDDQSSERSAVTNLVLKETLKYMQEQVPEIDRLVKALRFEFSSDKVDEKDAEATAKEKETETGEARAAKKTSTRDRLFVKTGLRIPVESGRPALVSETEARYGSLSSFIKVKLDGQYDNSLGFTYILGKDVHLQAERQVTHTTTTDPVLQDKMNSTSSVNLVQLVCKF